jgi:23S rRNA (pseudouridine1915-N3)-methyltransferase
MFKIKMISVGKTKEAWLKEALDAYSQRLKATASIEWVLLKNVQQLNDTVKKESFFICLDPNGKAYSSEEFSTFLFQQLIAQGARLTFVIGGPDGIPKEIIGKAAFLLSFSQMTFTHQMIRLLLLEQLYRAIEIHKGTAYHK